MADDDVKNSDPPSRAHDEKGGSGLVDSRVAHIVELKMALRYGRRAAKRLAAEWGVSEQYVHNLSCLANKAVRQSSTDPESVAAMLLPDLIATYKSASKSVRRSGGDPHAQAKMAASVAGLGTLLADISGLKAPKKTELTGADGGPVQVVGPIIFTPAESDD